MKTESRVGGPWTEDDYSSSVAEVPWQLEDALASPYPYQMQMAKAKEKRTLNVLFNADDNIGKSTLADMIEFLKTGWGIPPHHDTA
jgi:hypothetical protein